MKILSWMHCLIKKHKNEIIEQDDNILSDIVKKLQTENININIENRSDDGRVNSSLQETIITSFLKESKDIQDILNKYNMKLLIPHQREWFDFCLFNDNKFIPVNIKISSLKTADNVSSKKGLYYACTGVFPHSNYDELCKSDSFKTNKWTEFYKKLKEDVDKNENGDYYFLIINKNNTSDIFFTSLKTLKNITPNGNNLPFQCKWENNRERVFRSHKEARIFLIKAFYKSLKLSNESVSFGLRILRRLQR